MNTTQKQSPINEGDTVTAFNRSSKGRQKATVLSIYHQQFLGETKPHADVQFKDGSIQKGMLVGLLRAVSA